MNCKDRDKDKLTRQLQGRDKLAKELKDRDRMLGELQTVIMIIQLQAVKNWTVFQDNCKQIDT